MCGVAWPWSLQKSSILKILLSSIVLATMTSLTSLFCTFAERDLVS